ncbi:hypothetical protein [Salinibacter altiplanensis]|uniref:hypothetical protein n=1 Tax=Salinibacter altiplanensis TaxID=1803181 RepID=UPI000C9F6E8A|nr:hypothetical protein [Salinibacter altiplanensis]
MRIQILWLTEVTDRRISLTAGKNLVSQDKWKIGTVEKLFGVGTAPNICPEDCSLSELARVEGSLDVADMVSENG